ncbi:MAG: hypothetical protein IKX49_04510, partial [Clostridia bacterium]|nr:hypothetical protein [Clostridia bacterium]
MKKIALFIALVMVLSLLTVFVSAEADPECDLRPVEADDTNAKITVDGATIETDGNGTAKITLTAAVATITITFKDAAGTYEELRSNIRDEQKYIRYYFEYGDDITNIEIHGHYMRGDKDNADLYLSGMQNAPAYFKIGGAATDKYGVWDISKYLLDRADRNYVPADGIIQFNDNEFRIEGSVGSVFTIYSYDLADDYDED